MKFNLKKKCGNVKFVIQEQEYRHEPKGELSNLTTQRIIFFACVINNIFSKTFTILKNRSEKKTMKIHFDTRFSENK